jgi:hypothetical protein
VLIEGYRADGWAFGLAAAGLAADLDAPLLVVGDDLPEATASLLCSTPVDRLAVGDASVINQDVLDAVDALDESCG